MRRSGLSRPGALLLGLTLVAASAACRRSQPLCDFCRMPIPARTASSVQVNGVEHQVCDPRCALTHQHQTGDRSTLVSVTDFDTGSPLAPEKAVFVTGSDTAPDVEREGPREPIDPVYREWHRCLPSVLAFADRDAALRFQSEHGGSLQTLAELGYSSPGRPPGR